MRYASITVKSVLAGFFLLLASASAHAEVGSFTDYIENGVFFKEHPCFLYVEVREGAEIDDLKLNINPLKCYESYKSEMSKTSTDPALKTGTDSAPAVAGANTGTDSAPAATGADTGTDSVSASTGANTGANPVPAATGADTGADSAPAATGANTRANPTPSFDVWTPPSKIRRRVNRPNPEFGIQPIGQPDWDHWRNTAG